MQTVNGADVYAAVNAFEHAAAVNPTPARDRRNRLDESLLSDGHARILFGSNWPAASLDPRDAIEEAVAGPGELRNAIDAYTSHAAYASYDEHRKGTLARGMLADIVILSNDIFEPRAEALRESAVTVTFFDGSRVSRPHRKLQLLGSPKAALRHMPLRLLRDSRGSSLEDLHRELDAAIADAPRTSRASSCTSTQP